MVSPPHPPVRLLPFGEDAVLVEVDSLDAVLSLHARLAASPPDGVVELVPAARTILVRTDRATLPPARAREWVRASVDAPMPDAPAGAEVVLPIAYDGEDLADVARMLGVSVGEVVRRHSAVTWTVAFTGFAPGFGYLVSADWDHEIPRRESPRTRVPAGAVGLAGGFSGAYPRETPGGWQLIGTTSASLFDPGRTPAVLLTPGARVRFDPAADSPSAATAQAPAPPLAPAPAPPLAPAPAPPQAPPSAKPPPPAPSPAPAIRVLTPGLHASLQDAGRPGRAAEGIARAGAVDAVAWATANRLVGNAVGAAAIEVTMGGFSAVAERPLEIVVTGAWGPVRLDGRLIDPYVVQPWPRDAVLELDWFTSGVRAYIAVRGGVDAPPAAGSRSTDTLSALGPAPLRAGSTLAVARDAVAPVPALPFHPWGPPPGGIHDIPLVPGPRDDWFAPDALDTLFAEVWTVGSDADRVGVRLVGPPLRRIRDQELPSEAMLPGAVQVPPGGGPVVLGPDGPVTGGYPVVGVVTVAGMQRLAQAGPGSRLRFRRVAAP